jgi:hypothetical protein
MSDNELLVIPVTTGVYATSNAMGQVIWPLFQRFIDHEDLSPPIRYFESIEDAGSEEAMRDAQANFLADLEAQVSFWKAVEADEFFPLDATNADVAR